MTLKLFPSAKEEIGALEEKSRAVERLIVTDQHQFFLELSGLQPFLDVLKHWDNEVRPQIVSLTVFADSSLAESAIYSRKPRRFVTVTRRVPSERFNGCTITSAKTDVTSVGNQLDT